MDAAAELRGHCVPATPRLSTPREDYQQLRLDLLHLVLMLSMAICRRSATTAGPGDWKPTPRVAVPPQVASGRAGQTSGCAWTPWFSPANYTPTTYLLRSQQRAPAILCSVFPTRDLAQQFD